MTWQWLLLGFLPLGVVFLFSNPQRLHEYWPGALLSIVVGGLVEYGLIAARPVWHGANLFIPWHGVEITYVTLFYGGQGYLVLHSLPKSPRLQVPYVLAVAIGTTILEVLLSPLLFGVTEFALLGSAVLIHSLRLFALVALFIGLGFSDRAFAIRRSEHLRQKVHRALRVWQFAWPSMGVVAFAMLRVTSFFSRPR